MTLCFASNNQHKLDEIRNAVGESFSIVGLSELGCDEELPETQATLEGNSLQKAAYVFNRYEVPCFADDTGLEVEALQGAPGVYSARYAGDSRDSNANMALLLANLDGVSERKARFRTVITLIGVDKEPVAFEGCVYGHIATEKKGENGFGYDPVFIPEGFTKTFAEISMAEKNELSHRAIAIKKLARYLRDTQ